MATAAVLHPTPSLISVIIPVRNAAATLGEQLEALATQTYSGRWEVIVADNGSADGTAQMARTWPGMPVEVTVVDASARRGPSYARTAGAQAARGDFLAFCDGDDVVDRQWLASLATSARDFDIVTGMLEASRLNSAAVVASRPPRAAGLPAAGFLPFAPSGNFGVWAAIFAATGGFDDHYGQCEDVEWSWRAQLSSYRLGFAPDAVVHYRYRTTLSAIARQAYARGKCLVRLYRDFRDEGMPQPAMSLTVRRWGWVVLKSPWLLSRTRRGTWMRRAGESAGRLVGSIEMRVWFL